MSLAERQGDVGHKARPTGGRGRVVTEGAGAGVVKQRPYAERQGMPA